THGEGTREVSSVHWHYGNLTIPRHLRDVAITEYGVADLRDRSDGECVQAMLQLTDARFQQPIIDAAKHAFKLRDNFVLPPDRTPNTPDKLADRLGEARRSGLLPDYPLGSDFSDVEQRLVRALTWLKANTVSKLATVRLLASALLSKPARDNEAMQRMGFIGNLGWKDRLQARLLAYALARTRA
ncbi:MAG TPA: acetyl-CoA hydrolase/transferase C-terminal domain-containing protein, partial [Gammaproteobacteria bacterium]|nr:acetyl-CoA hydrolase/transferase C-terminal domain-containing protein [Gammaproteobacteria bacterium]